MLTRRASLPQVILRQLQVVLKQVRKVSLAVSEGSAATLLLYFLVMAFLAVQDRIDRNDPKLALAPVYGEPDLAFEAPPHPGDELE